MKFPVMALLWLLCCGVALAQTQERKLLDRMLKPDLQQGNPLQSRSYSAGGRLALREASENKDTFSTRESPYVKDYAFTRSFFGIKNPWFGNKVFDAKKADSWAARTMYGSDKVAETKTAATREFPSEDKKANFGSPVVPVREFVSDPKAPGSISNIKDKISKDMTIDQVRELLNKPR